MSCERNESGRGITWGIILIAVGSIFLLDNFDFLYIEDVWKYWPVILIAIGIAKLSSVAQARTRS